MADKKISELTALSSANLQDADLLPIVDFDITNSDSSPANTSKQTKSITIGDLKTSIFTNSTFAETITITRSGTGTATAPQLILKDADGTNETTHIYNHSGRTAIVGRNENAKGIIDFIQDDGTTQNTAMKISSAGFVGIDEVSPKAPLHINVTDFPSGTPRGIIIQRDANEDGTIMGTITFNNGENLDSPENNSPRFDGNIARIRTTLQSNVDDNSPNPDAGGSMALQTKEEGGSLETRIEIRESGMIGIGTSTPASKLHIKQSSQDDHGGIKLEKSDASNTWSIWQNSSSTLFFQNASTATGAPTTRAWLSTAGKLNVTGDLAVGGANVVIDSTGVAATQELKLDTATGQDNLISFEQANGSNGGSIRYEHASASSNMKFGIAGSVALTIAVTSISTDRPITSSGTIKSTSATERPIQNDETDTTPIRTIRRISQSDYDAESPPDANTLYIIV